MAPCPRSHSTGRGLAQSEQAPPQEGSFLNTLHAAVSEKREQSSTSVPVVAHLPNSVKALAGAITILGLALILIGAWKIRSWRLKQRAAARQALPPSEKRSSLSKEIILTLEPTQSRFPSKAVLLPPIPPTPDLAVCWVPQIRSVREPSSGALAGVIPAKKRQTRCPRIKEKLRATTLFAPSAKQTSPPPSYFIANRRSSPPSAPATGESTANSRTSIPGLPAIPPLPMGRSDLPLALPPTPPPSLKLKHVPSLSAVPPQMIASPMRTSSNKPTSAIAKSSVYINTTQSNRSSRTDASNSSSRFSADSDAPKRFPRLVTVVNLYPPSQPDELKISAGEVLHLLEEYEDEWCLVQRVGHRDAEKGVVPRFCLADRKPAAGTSHRLTLNLGSKSGSSL